MKTKEKLAWLAELYQGEATFTKDSRVRSNIENPNYNPPPPPPIVKLHMIEEDLMRHIAALFDEKCHILTRRTTKQNVVYRVSIYKRDKVEAFLRCILPYVYGNLKRSLIEDLLQDCDNYNKWLDEGGRKKAAAHAAKAKNKK